MASFCLQLDLYQFFKINFLFLVILISRSGDLFGAPECIFFYCRAESLCQAWTLTRQLVNQDRLILSLSLGLILNLISPLMNLLDHLL